MSTGNSIPYLHLNAWDETAFLYQLNKQCTRCVTEVPLWTWHPPFGSDQGTTLSHYWSKNRARIRDLQGNVTMQVTYRLDCGLWSMICLETNDGLERVHSEGQRLIDSNLTVRKVCLCSPQRTDMSESWRLLAPVPGSVQLSIDDRDCDALDDAILWKQTNHWLVHVSPQEYTSGLTTMIGPRQTTCVSAHSLFLNGNNRLSGVFFCSSLSRLMLMPYV